MTIIEMQARADGGHGLQSQSGREACWLDGWISVPAGLEEAVWETLGWCDLQIEDGTLVGITPKDRPESEPAEPVKPDPQNDPEQAVYQALAAAYMEGVADA